MTNPTSNYSFVLPTSTDLVTDLPADFEVALQGVDTRLKALQPGTTLGDLAYSSATANTNTRLPIGTTGQVLTVVGGVPAWSSEAGDIEGVTAGVGISGGGTSGTVTVTNSMATAITTNGDLIYGTGSGTFTRRGIGSTGNVLTVSGGIPVWAAPAGGGKVLQVVQGIATTGLSSSSGTFVDTGLTATITPSAASSKVLILVAQGGIKKTSTTSGPQMSLKLMRGATDLLQHDNLLFTGTNLTQFYTSHAFNLLDSPATTSATTYKTQFSNPGGSAEVAVQNGGASYIILMEIGA